MSNEMEIELRHMIGALLDHSYAYYGNVVDIERGVGMIQEAARNYLKVANAERPGKVFQREAVKLKEEQDRALFDAIPMVYSDDQPTDISVLDKNGLLVLCGKIMRLIREQDHAKVHGFGPLCDLLIPYIRYAGDESIRKDEAPAMDALADGLSPSPAPTIDHSVSGDNLGGRIDSVSRIPARLVTDEEIDYLRDNPILPPRNDQPPTGQPDIEGFLIALGRPHLRTAFRGDGNPTDDQVAREIGSALMQLHLGLAVEVESIDAPSTQQLDIREHSSEEEQLGDASLIGSGGSIPPASTNDQPVGLPVVTLQTLAEALVTADTDGHGSEDWKHYKHMAEAVMPLVQPEPVVDIEMAALQIEELFDSQSEEPATGVDERAIAKACAKSWGLRYVD